MSPIGWAGLLPELDRDSIVPLYRQIYEHLREAILTGTLPESTRLPPERTMAERLAVNRSTIVHAYRELVRDSLIEQRVGSGSRVVPQVRGGQPERAAGVPWWITLPPWRVGAFPNVLGELAAKPEPGRISFVQGVAPDEPSPLAELAKSFGRVARDPRFVLSYGDSEGYEPLRAAIAARMNARGARTVTPGSVIVLTGSTQGIAIVAQSLAEPGDEIIVESPSYPGALQVFQINGLRAISVPVDDDGMRVDHVEAVLRTRRPRFIYTMPSLHNPTNATMNADRRERLATIARRAGVPIVEDDPYGPLAPAGTPLVALAPDHVVYISTFSKTIAPSLRVGWLVAPRTILERLLLRKQAYDMATSLYVQAAIADYLERGYDAHVEVLRNELFERRAVADEAIGKHWPTGLKATCGSGGFYLWASTPREVRARALLDASERLGASFLFGEAFFANSGGDHYFRLALTAPARREIGEGIRRIGEAISAIRS
ncbi:MAG TPA: PLP-dependent aminotransferase family protein [Candidatus Babeliales bacterium]|nr:PLP-dependent aminotransferase family protein [Candidatus Babeliales bacterium]